MNNRLWCKMCVFNGEQCLFLRFVFFLTFLIMYYCRWHWLQCDSPLSYQCVSSACFSSEFFWTCGVFQQTFSDQVVFLSVILYLVPNGWTKGKERGALWLWLAQGAVGCLTALDKTPLASTLTILSLFWQKRKTETGKERREKWQGTSSQELCEDSKERRPMKHCTKFYTKRGLYTCYNGKPSRTLWDAVTATVWCTHK